MKIRTRLLITSILLFAAGSYWLVDWVLKDFRFHYFMAMEESMNDTATLLSSMVAEQAEDLPLSIDPSFRNMLQQATSRELNADIYDFKKTKMNLRVLVTDSQGLVVFDSQNAEAEGEDYSQWRDILLTLDGQYGARATESIPNDPESLNFFIASPIIVDDTVIGVVSIGKPTSSIRPHMRRAKNRFIATGISAVSAVLLLQVLISFWVTHPIEELITYARKIRDGRKVPRPPLHHSEMGDLATAFEEMRDALEGKQYVENYVQTLTHEMKSPLSAIRGASELLNEPMPDEQRDRFLRNIHSETQRAHNLVDRLLALAGLEKRKEIENATSIDATALLQDILNSHQPVAQKKTITLQCSTQPPVKLHGEEFLLRQAISNLIQNAIDFSPANGTVCIEAVQKGHSIRIIVQDEGPGIPDYAAAKVFERFYSLPRPDHKQKSSGLGLNFVHEVATLHGGSIELTQNSPHGVIATLTLPSG